MNRVLQAFGRAKVVLPVVHCVCSTQVRTAVSRVRDSGADGVFLINQGGMSAHLLVREADRAKSSGWVGVNLLGLGYEACLDAADGLDGLWVDNAGVYPDPSNGQVADTRLALLFRSMRVSRGWGGLYFGGVAFKGCVPVPLAQLEVVAQAGVGAGVDVVTTSGPATGSPPSVEKVAAMRRAVGDAALAVASGMTPENVWPLLPLADAFLVASGVEHSFGEFDVRSLRNFVEAVHAGGPQ